MPMPKPMSVPLPSGRTRQARRTFRVNPIAAASAAVLMVAGGADAQQAAAPAAAGADQTVVVTGIRRSVE